MVITLIYLAIQVRHSRQATDANTRSLELQTSLAIESMFGASNDLVTQSADLATVIVRGDEGLSVLGPDERIRYEAYQARRMNALEMTHSVGIPAENEAFLGACAGGFLSTRGAREWWDQGFFSPAFCKWAHKYLTNAPKGATFSPELVDHLAKLE